jgi:hypothetical protein
MRITEQLDLYQFTLTADNDLMIDANNTHIELERRLLAALALFLSRRDVRERVNEIERELGADSG